MALQQATLDPSVSFRSPVRRSYHRFMSACGAVAAALFGAMALLVCADVLMRNLGLGSIAWSVEATEYILMIATFVAAPWLLYLGDHIRVDVVVRALSAPARRFVGLASDLACFVVCAVLAWQSVAVTLDTAEQGSLVFKVLVFPEWWLNLPMAFSCALLAVEFARRAATGAWREEC
ncbi:MAG: TRAP transporter small permease [Aromatoleum sp.]|jgi:TRAP-type C4-dicarboxylate transport system permease small subunit|uniref:TRAP transporter small permease n=1 Tax=Aromatoleum sp. TaxID=2307007 RepID=UPI00289470FA|nr:TRAP transporter small permease [Aromatoleum sp.]MDT3669453.1 TRAP transporter small permease [Aromatoleum sp.]